MFPGQGALRASTSHNGVPRARFESVLTRIASSTPDSKGAEVTRQLATSLRQQAPNTPAELSLFVYAGSIAHHLSLEDNGVHPGVLIGHAFGEIPALVCGGALSIERGAEIVVHRTAVLTECRRSGGAMIALKASLAAAERLVALTGSKWSGVAAENSPSDVVISGTIDAIEAVRHMTAREGIPT